MILCDVNVVLAAVVSTTAAHAVCREALVKAAEQRNSFGINRTVFAGVVRIGSNPRIFSPPCLTSDLFDRLDALSAQFTCVAVEPGARHWALFRSFVDDFRLSSAGVMDAWYAALAIEHDAEWWTCDGGFAKYPGLRLRHLAVPT
jgi:uncharacterized protein